MVLYFYLYSLSGSLLRSVVELRSILRSVILCSNLRSVAEPRSVLRWPVAACIDPGPPGSSHPPKKNPVAALHLFDNALLRYPSYRHTSAVYSAVLSALSPALPCLLPHFCSVLSSMVRDTSPARDLLFASAISSFFPSPPTPSPSSNCVSWPRSFHAIPKLLLSRNDLETAHQVLVESYHRPEVKIGIESLNLIIESLCRLGRADLALEVFSHADKIFSEMVGKGFKPNAKIFEAKMSALCKEGRADDAAKVLDEENG